MSFSRWIDLPTPTLLGATSARQVGSYPSSNPELVSRCNGPAIGSDDLQELFALNMATALILERRHNAFAVCVDYITGRWVSVTPVDAECNPARLVAHFDGCDLPGRHHRRIKYVHAAVVRVGQP